MLTTARAREERKLYERLIVFQEDFGQATYFAEHLLKKGWHFDPWDKKIRWTTYLQQVAFTTALVVAYCRPFAQTRGNATLSMKLAPYNHQERQLHDKILALRNSVYAHSDVELYKVRPVAGGGHPTAIMKMQVLKLTKPETELFLTMIPRTLQSIKEKLHQLSPTVNAKPSNRLNSKRTTNGR